MRREIPDRFQTIAELRAWLHTLTETELSAVIDAANLCRELPLGLFDGWAEDRVDCLYALADGEGDNRMFAKAKATK